MPRLPLRFLARVPHLGGSRERQYYFRKPSR